MSTGSGLFALLGLEFEQILGQIISVRVKTLSNTNMVASRHIKIEKGSLSVDVRRSLFTERQHWYKKGLSVNTVPLLACYLMLLQI